MSGSQSTDALVKELIDCCRSESLSVDGLREIIEKYDCDCASNKSHVDRNYDFFIVACCNGSVTEGILRYLLEYFSSAASATTSRGETPLHMICNNKNATRGMVQLLIDAFPGSLDRAINAGAIGVTPLHFLCFNKDIDDSNAVDILGLLLERHPGAVQLALTNGSGALPIHIAAGQGSKSPEFCHMLMEAYPRSERMTVPGGHLPLHIACRHGTVETVQHLLRLYPESINATNSSGHYPIHYAMEGLNGRTNPATAIEVVQLLLDCDPDLALQKMNGIFPLVMIKNYATNNRNNASKVNAALKILQLFYNAQPAAIEDKGMTGHSSGIPRKVLAFINTQLTYARQVRNSTVRQMKKRDENGQAPLHRALRDNVTLGSIKLIVKRNPSAVLIPDNSGALPLHVAIQHHDSPKVVDYLIGLDPNTLTAVDREGNTALHLACRGAKYDTIALLLEKYGAVSVSQSNVLNKLPIHLLFESNAVTNREDDTKYLETIFRLLRFNPETVMLSGDEKQQSIPQGGRPSRSGKKRKYYA